MQILPDFAENESNIGSIESELNDMRHVPPITFD